MSVRPSSKLGWTATRRGRGHGTLKDCKENREKASGKNSEISRMFSSRTKNTDHVSGGKGPRCKRLPHEEAGKYPLSWV